MSDHADTSTQLSHHRFEQLKPPPVLSQDQQNAETLHHDDEDNRLLLGRQVTIVRRPTKGPIPKPVDYTSLLCGLAAGVAQAGVFNPDDRALYLSIKDSRPFLSKENWTRPYSGFIQSLGGRALGEQGG